LWLQDVLDREISPIKTESYINEKGNLEIYISEENFKFSKESKEYQFFLNHQATKVTNSTERILSIVEPYYWKKDQVYDLEQPMNTVFIKLIDTGFTQDEIDSAKSQGEVTGVVSGGTSTATEAIGSIALFGAFDVTGVSLKFLQMVKLFRRVRFLHIKFGVMLEAFLKALDPGFPQTQAWEERNYIFQGQTPGKLKFDIIPVLWFYPGNLIKPILYIVLWLAKLAILPYIYDLKDYRRRNVILPVPKKFVFKCKVIFFVRKFEFMLFNMVLADALFIGSRTVGSLKIHLFTQYLDSLESTSLKLQLIMSYFFTVLTMVALFTDFMEIFSVSLRVWNLEHI
jgi:hypothetical protein